MSEEMEISAEAAKRSEQAPAKTGDRRGKARLRKAAGEALKEKSKQIADSLAENAAKGSVQSARLLLELSELPGATRKKKSPEASLAEKWSQEPEWKEDGTAGEE
jgi:hypothetical protein